MHAGASCVTVASHNFCWCRAQSQTAAVTALCEAGASLDAQDRHALTPAHVVRGRAAAEVLDEFELLRELAGQ